MSNDNIIPLVQKHHDASNKTMTLAEVIEDAGGDWEQLIKDGGFDPDNSRSAFFKRADAARRMFGLWDLCDPVAHAIIALVEAQNELAAAIMADGAYGARIIDCPNIGDALNQRAELAVDLMRALVIEREHTWTPQGWAYQCPRCAADEAEDD
jgi:hypothetical protein